MRDIQSVGIEILSNKPSKFYIFAGTEYGIKQRYIEHMSVYYDNCIECDSVATVLDKMSHYSLLDSDNALYIIRYDEQFLSTLDNKTESMIDSLNITGTVVCIYESAKALNKLSKYLANYTVEIKPVSAHLNFDYMKSEFGNIPDRVLSGVIALNISYGRLRNIGHLLSYVPSDVLDRLSVVEINTLLGCRREYTELQLQICIARRDVVGAMCIIDTYVQSPDSIYYIILKTMVELDGLRTRKYSKSELAAYAKNWSVSELYTLYYNTYLELKRSRSQSMNIYNSIIDLISLLGISPIPYFEVE